MHQCLPFFGNGLAANCLDQQEHKTAAVQTGDGEQIEHAYIYGNEDRQIYDGLKPFQEIVSAGGCLFNYADGANRTGKILQTILTAYQFHQRHPDQLCGCNRIFCRIGNDRDWIFRLSFHCEIQQPVCVVIVERNVFNGDTLAVSFYGNVVGSSASLPVWGSVIILMRN